MRTMTRDWSQASDEEILGADLIIELGFDTLSPEAQRKFLDTISHKVDKVVWRRILTALPADQQQPCRELLESGQRDEAIRFIDPLVPNYGELVSTELIRFKRTMLTKSPEEIRLGL